MHRNPDILPGGFDCNCFQRNKPTICKIAEGNTDDLHQYIETGWQHFIQHRREKDVSIPTEETPRLQDAEDLPTWSGIRHKFLTPITCIHSPNFIMCRYWDPGCENPLINAIRAQSGYPLSWFEVWQALFLRFRSGLSFDLTDYEPTRAGTLTAIEVDTAQTDCITEEEVEKRTRKYFWKGSEGPYFRNRYTEAVHPLVLAASLPSTKIIDQLLTTNADRSFWMAFPALKAIPEQPTPSSLALSSPPHEPIASGNIEMLTYLLQAGFNPNILPLGDVCTRMTPFMATILDCVSWNEPAYEILARDPRIDFNIRTYSLTPCSYPACSGGSFARSPPAC